MKNIALSTICFLLTACAGNTPTKKVQLVTPPDNLLISPCKVAEAGSTVGSLAEGYVRNTACVWQFEGRTESLRKWKAEQQGLYLKK